MENVKRIEIITDALEMSNVCAKLDAVGVSGYSVIKDVVGKGDRGSQLGDELTDVFKNSYLLTTCDAAGLEALVKAIRPILKRHGGICLVSDAQWVEH